MDVWRGSTLLDKLEEQSSQGRVPPRGLLTDIDRTYLLREGSFWHRRRYLKATRALTAYTDRNHFPRVAVTARDMPMMRDDHRAGLLPQFDVVLASLGAERYILRGDDYVRDVDYDRFVRTKSGYQRDLIYPACLSFLDVARQWAAESGLRGLNLTLQPRDRLDPGENEEDKPPQPYKISYNFYAHDGRVRLRLKDLLRRHLDAAGHTNVKAVFSVDSVRAGRVRYNIDIVPISKGEAAGYFLDDIEKLTGRVSWFYAGDSGNDESALARVGDGAIIVGGHTIDLQVLGDNWRPMHRPPRWFRDHLSRRRMYVDDGSLLGPESVMRALSDIDHFEARTDS